MKLDKERKINRNLRLIFHKVYDDTCQYCGCKLNGKGQVEHIIPKSKGGLNTLLNLTLSCKECNCRKNSKDISSNLYEILTNNAKNNAYRIIRCRPTKQVSSLIIIRNVPESIRRELKAKSALEGKSMQGLILELITRFVKDEKDD